MVAEIITVRLEIKNEEVREDLERVVSSVKGFRLQKTEGREESDLLIMEIGDDLPREFQRIQFMQNSGATREIFVTSSRVEPELIIKAYREGVKEFFSQPIKPEEIVKALLKFKERAPSEERKKRGKLVTVLGSKGGVGTTTIAVNLATAFAQLEGSPRVVLLDMNFFFGEIHLFMDAKSMFHWGEIAGNVSRIDPTYMMSVLFKHSSGVHVLSSPNGISGVNSPTPAGIEKLLGLMLTEFDLIVIDAGRTLDENTIKILELSDTVLLVAILNLPSLTNVKRLMWTFQKLGYPEERNVKIIASRYLKKSLISLKEAEETLNREIFWEIPNDYLSTMSAINQGKTLSMMAHGAEITKCFARLASAFVEKGEKKEEKSRFWKAFSR
jgi:pilus assembly protein CpaE